MSNKYVNLRKIVKYLHEEDIESHFNLQILLERYAHSEIGGTFILI